MGATFMRKIHQDPKHATIPHFLEFRLLMHDLVHQLFWGIIWDY